MDEFTEAITHDYGRSAVLVNNVGFAVAGFVQDLRLDEIHRQFETHSLAAVAMTKAVPLKVLGGIR